MLLPERRDQIQRLIDGAVSIDINDMKPIEYAQWLMTLAHDYTFNSEESDYAMRYIGDKIKGEKDEKSNFDFG